MVLRNLDDIRNLFSSLDAHLVGVGMTASSRVAPAEFLDRFPIVARRETRDLDSLRERTDVFCLEEATGGLPPETILNSADLVEHPLVTRFLRTLPRPTCLFVYQSYSRLENIARQEGWRVLANPAGVRARVAQRSFFKQAVADLGLAAIPGAIHPLEELEARSYRQWAELVGPRFVIQLPEVAQGGGKGTFFIANRAAYGELRARLREKTWRGAALRTVSIHRFVRGAPASTCICVTRHGVLVSGLQRQIIDLPHCKHMPEDGVFCGHSWGGRAWPETVESEARRQSEEIGAYLARLGYRGIAGIDFLVEEKCRRVYALEINPRLTGALPMLSLLHSARGMIPFEAFHILEFLDLPYEIDVERLNEGYAEPVRGSHVLVFRSHKDNEVKTDTLKAGLYEHTTDPDQLRFLRGALDYRDIEDQSQFVVTDGPPAAGGPIRVSSDPMHRLCRILFSYPVLDHAGELLPAARRAVDWVHNSMITNTN